MEINYRLTIQCCSIANDITGSKSDQPVDSDVYAQIQPNNVTRTLDSVFTKSF